VKLLIALAILGSLALLGSRRTFVARRLPLGAQLVFLTGTEFILVGVALGSGFLGLVDEAALRGLEPFVGGALGWVGFLFGLQFEGRSMRNLPRRFFAVSIVQALFTAVVVFLVFRPLLWRMLGGHAPAEMIALATLAAAAACTGQAGLALADRHRGGGSLRVLRLLRYTSSVDPLVGLAIFGTSLSLFASHNGHAPHFPGSLQWLVLSLGMGLLSAWIFVSLTATRTSEPELVLYLVGTLALASGSAMYFQLSTLFVCCVCGVAVANLSHRRGRVVEAMAQGERFVYVLLLLLAGASWRFSGRVAFLLAGVYILARLAGKLGGGFLARRLVGGHYPLPRAVGLGLLSQSGMALAIVIDLQHSVQDAMSQLVLSVAILGIIVNELVGPALAVRLVREPAGAPAQ